ncbi:Subtilase family protein [Tenacibaculum sp. MAR_2009_124]|uniref:S8 family peptidase n=1 Tax=Tenacibaculum sp. MAR_2009_124 TaxID=1250059 RepID=UPI0008971B75|nr:S8 family serine peptidase [Tenacibaculum sp. MAR_2009_124]SEB75946.1 Subtilase family protein [Tenacibaculum sp. MAR_2009_124]
MKKHILSLGIILAMFSCSHNESIEESNIQQEELLTKKEINDIIKRSIESSGDFLWSDQDVHTIYSALKHGNDILTVGYGSTKDNFERSPTSETIKQDILTLINSTEKAFSKGKNEIYADDNINVIDVKINNQETLTALLNDSSVRYIEPADYSFFENEQVRSSKGCGYRQQNLSSSDYRTVAPGARVPWSFDLHKIPQAWNHSTGAGITIAVIDTGLSPQQKWMNQYFNDGYSNGRTVQKYGTFVDSWWPWSNNYDGVNDKCGHGTSMASVATAPRNNNNLPVGVAYNANLVSYRAVENVIIDDYHEKRGVAEALTALGKRSDVKVISMSIGSPFSISRVKDAVKYAYNRGKMIIAAGGTSTTFTTWFGVIFPASMNETVAVTGIKEGVYDNCDTCHSGSKIDFTIQMQRTNGTDNKVPVLSYYNGKSDYEGGSSIATATTAGIAALVWSKHPSWSRAQVLQKMKQSSDYYPSKNSEYGHGNINALKAVQ